MSEVGMEPTPPGETATYRSAILTRVQGIQIDPTGKLVQTLIVALLIVAGKRTCIRCLTIQFLRVKLTCQQSIGGPVVGFSPATRPGSIPGQCSKLFDLQQLEFCIVWMMLTL